MFYHKPLGHDQTINLNIDICSCQISEIFNSIRFGIFFWKQINKTLSMYENEAIIWSLFASEENFIFPLTREKQEYFFLIKGIFEPNVLPIEHDKLNSEDGLWLASS